MAHTIIIPQNTHVEFDISAEYVGKPLKVTWSSLDEVENQKPKKTMADFIGIISKERGEEIQEEIRKSRKEWEKNI